MSIAPRTNLIPFLLSFLERRCASTGFCLAAALILTLFAPPLALADDPARTTQHIQGGPISVDFTLDKTSLNAAESLTATLEVTSPPAVAITLPSPTDKLGEFSVSATTDDPAVALSSSGEPRTRLTRRFTLDPFLPGDYSLPALEIAWHRADSGESGVARTAPVFVHVASLLPESAQKSDASPAALDPGGLRDAYTPPAHRNWMPLVLGSAAGITAALLTGWGAQALRRRRPGKDPVEVLLSQVHALRATTDEDGVALCHQLADALHAALGARLGSSTRSLSTTEIAARLPRGPFFSADQSQSLQNLLESLDAIRFSGASVSAEQRERFIKETLNLLRALRDMPKGGAR